MHEDETGLTCFFSNPTPPSLFIADGQLVLEVSTLDGNVDAGVGRFVSSMAVAYDDQPGNEGIYVSDASQKSIMR